MFLQQIKTWTEIKPLHSRSRVSRVSSGDRVSKKSVNFNTSAPAEGDGNDVTCADATGVETAKVAPELGYGCPIAASCIKEGLNDNARPFKFAGSDPYPSKTHPKTKTQLVRMRNNVTTLMLPFSYHDPGYITSASCLPREGMWRPCEQAEQLEIPTKSPVETNQHVFHNPHDMLGTVSNTSYADGRIEDLALVEERDKDTLRAYFHEPTNIVLHSDCPHIAPHIVITPAEESPNDFYTPWNNRTLPQWSGFLMVPPYDLATGRLCPPSYHLPSPELDSQCSDDDTLVDENISTKDIAATPTKEPKRVFCRSRFTNFVEMAANERLILYHVVTALQKRQCKAAAYAASARAADFSQRYALPQSLASIERPFVWTDPAGPLLACTVLSPGATLLESSCPFIAPHILISSAPPQNPWIPWHNAVNDPQDGRYLVVPSPRVNYINMDDDEGEAPEPRWTTSSTTRFFLASDDDEDEYEYPEDGDYGDEDDPEVDQSESLPPSRPSSPGPETPTDDTTFLRGFFNVRRPSFVIDEDDEDNRALALAIAKNATDETYKHGGSLLRLSLPVVEEEDLLDDEGFSPAPPMQVRMMTDEDNDLPSLVNWYFEPSDCVRLALGVQITVA